MMFVAELDKHQHHYVGGEIGERMDGIGYHGSRMPQDAGSKLQHEQQHIDNAACYSHLVNFS